MEACANLVALILSSYLKVAFYFEKYESKMISFEIFLVIQARHQLIIDPVYFRWVRLEGDHTGIVVVWAKGVPDYPIARVVITSS